MQTASAYVDAYNDRDLDGMLSLMHEDVQWLSVEGEKVEVFANGKADLAAQMESYLASPMATLSEIDGSVSDGRFVAVREIAHWTDNNGDAKEQSALAVYEIEDGLVRRVWY
ncbi:MAG: nuclear transport factor 2 family protein, partial [Pseudomonadota bacterium]